MFYHVLVETSEKIGKSNQNKKIYELDIRNRDDILNQTITPYLKKEKFQFDGYFLNYEDIVRIVIKSSERSVRELAKYENDNMEPGLIMYISPEDIVDYESKFVSYTSSLGVPVLINYN
ncbi:hypothetical protein [Clostridium grantii]|uniref:Uncharacterized protein n=1 Tax=Clostridium grantii DSM 8605 TaxID=1121316 RepID=A0A1M5VK85_9CLOT|nr:hypothetical protein [Clostridium grantii]SHH75676.1 hypothetical protein SAMN02745207_02312 [Clostridium grantii DSM 8605]